jgi:hypothetical protein
MEAEIAAMRAQLDRIETKLDGVAAQCADILNLGLVLSQLAESDREHRQVLRDMEDLVSREARATRSMIRMAPTSAATRATEDTHAN